MIPDTRTALHAYLHARTHACSVGMQTVYGARQQGSHGTWPHWIHSLMLCQCIHYHSPNSQWRISCSVCVNTPPSHKWRVTSSVCVNTRPVANGESLLPVGEWFSKVMNLGEKLRIFAPFHLKSIALLIVFVCFKMLRYFDLLQGPIDTKRKPKRNISLARFC